MHTLDAIDRKILSLLQSDSRATMQQLADQVGLSRSRRAIAGSSFWKSAA